MSDDEDQGWAAETIAALKEEIEALRKEMGQIGAIAYRAQEHINAIAELLVDTRKITRHELNLSLRRVRERVAKARAEWESPGGPKQ